MWDQRAGWWEIGPSGHGELKVRGAFKGELTPGPSVPACPIETMSLLGMRSSIYLDLSLPHKIKSHREIRSRSQPDLSTY